MSNFKLKVKLLNENAQIPKKAYPTDAGYDLCSCEEGIIQPKERAVVGTGISVNLQDLGDKLPWPFALYARIAPRSGLAVKYGIDVLAGVVDAGYTGEIKVILYNTSNEPFEYKIGDRIAQLVTEAMIPMAEVLTEGTNEVTETLDSERGENGFGSSG
jgi:dUTP pyrophosphatase